MAKDNPEGATVQYKVLIRPTDVGLLVMKPLQRPALDKSAELRRLIELGYAAEQAGFILDGTILRNGGRVWDVQPVLTSESGQEQSIATNATAAAPPSMSSAKGAGSTAEPHAEPSATADAAAASQDSTKRGGGTGLRANLRKLSNP